MEGGNKPWAVKIGFLGDPHVGKTSLCNNYNGIEFDENIVPTIGAEKFEKKIRIKSGDEIKLIYWDTSWQERFRSSSFKCIRSVHAIILVFDITSKSSFENLNHWLEDIKDNFDNPNLVLFGNKVDLEEKREVSKEEIEKFAKNNKIAYFETSAKTGNGINEGFDYIANETYHKLCSRNVPRNIILDEDEYTAGCFGKKKKKKKKKKKCLFP